MTPIVPSIILIALLALSHAQVGIPDPTPTFVTSEYVIVDRRVTIFCLVTCGGECEKCCDYHLDPYNPEAYMDICKGRTGAERSVCLELLGNLEFICTRASYKYQTNRAVQEWTAQPVFSNKKRGASFRPALGLTTAAPLPLSTGKKRAAEEENHYKHKYTFVDDDYVPVDGNYTGVAFQEVFVCASRRGAVHYRPIVPDTTSPSPSPSPVLPFWENTPTPSPTPAHHHHSYREEPHHDDYGHHDYGHHDDYGHQDDYGHYDDYGHHDDYDYEYKAPRYPVHYEEEVDYYELYGRNDRGGYRN
eukprot:TRINITY_DN983_c0_g1_i3.p1 TRINITY_DN983_c0_g1~~TRINITY_DN983_c0_g1_i3.p1  ORF type:complete len:303 (+),score=24.29 TRINITY_DN983_c0_g1_i3:25-933(+)